MRLDDYRQRDYRCRCSCCRRWMRRRPAMGSAYAVRRPPPNAGRCVDCPPTSLANTTWCHELALDAGGVGCVALTFEEPLFVVALELSPVVAEDVVVTALVVDGRDVLGGPLPHEAEGELAAEDLDAFLPAGAIVRVDLLNVRRHLLRVRSGLAVRRPAHPRLD